MFLIAWEMKSNCPTTVLGMAAKNAATTTISRIGSSSVRSSYLVAGSRRNRGRGR